MNQRGAPTTRTCRAAQVEQNEENVELCVNSRQDCTSGLCNRHANADAARATHDELQKHWAPTVIAAGISKRHCTAADLERRIRSVRNSSSSRRITGPGGESRALSRSRSSSISVAACRRRLPIQETTDGITRLLTAMV